MLSLTETLTTVATHLPTGFTARAGVKSLFPQGYHGSVSALANYVYFTMGVARTASEANDFARYCIGADGSGKWYFSFLGWPPDMYDKSAGINVRVQSGFVFLFSPDGLCRGYIDNSQQGNRKLSCNSGIDAWISANWPQLFTSGTYCGYQEAGGFTELPPESNIWGSAGFATNKFIALNGGNGPCGGSPSPSGALGSGSSLFPLPTFSADQYVAAIVAGAVAQAIKKQVTITVGIDTVKQAILSPNYPKSVSAAITAYTANAACPSTISNARIIAAAAVRILSTQHTSTSEDSPQIRVLSDGGTPQTEVTPDVTAGQVVAAGTAAQAAYAGDAVEGDFFGQLLASLAVTVSVTQEVTELAAAAAAEGLIQIAEWVGDALAEPSAPYPGPDPADGGIPGGVPDS